MKLKDLKEKFLEINYFMKKINKYDSKRLQTIRCICDSIYYCNSEIDEANKKQAGLLKHNLELNSKTKPKKDNRRKNNTLECENYLYEG